MNAATEGATFSALLKFFNKFLQSFFSSPTQLENNFPLFSTFQSQK